MAISEAALRENYRRFSDEKLLRLAVEDAAKLRPEALMQLREELKARGLGGGIGHEIEAQLRVLSKEEIEAYCALLQAVPCPICHSSTQRLNATVTRKVSSFMIATTWKEERVIACPSCLDKLIQDATSHSIIVGWWAMPLGIIQTVRAIIANKKIAKSHHAPHPNSSLKAFVVAHVRSIDAAEGNLNKLHAFLISLRLQG